jgi:hypothetical protein
MSKLTPRQWINIERAVLRDKEPMRQVAKRYKVDESVIRKRLEKARTEQVEEVAIQVATAEKSLKALKPIERVRARSLAEMLTEMSHTMSEVAEMDMRNALALTRMKADRVAVLEPGNADQLREVVLLSEAANKSAKLGVDLMTIGKQSLVDADKDKAKDREVMAMAPINIPSFQKS